MKIEQKSKRERDIHHTRHQSWTDQRGRRGGGGGGGTRPRQTGWSPGRARRGCRRACPPWPTCGRGSRPIRNRWRGGRGCRPWWRSGGGASPRWTPLSPRLRCPPRRRCCCWGQRKKGKMELSKKVHGEHNITTNAKQISPYNTFSLFYIHSVWVIGVMRNRLN